MNFFQSAYRYFYFPTQPKIYLEKSLLVAFLIFISLGI